MPRHELPRAVRRALERQRRRAEKALSRGDLKAATRLGLKIRHQVRLVRNGEVVLDLGGDE